MYIETQRMIIRNFTPVDAGDLHQILGDDITMAYCEPAYDFEKTRDFLHSFCIQRNGALAAVVKESQKVIGYLLFHHQGDGIYEMGWFFNRNYWRQGYARESCTAVIDYAFRTHMAHKIFAETIDITKSVALMKKLGFQLEGIQRSQVRDLQGNWTDLHLYGLLADDWRQARA